MFRLIEDAQRIFTSLAFLAFFTGCASVSMEYDVPLTRFHSPEAKGKLLRTELAADVGIFHEVGLGSVTEGGCFIVCASYNTSDSKSIDSAVGLGLKAQTGIFNIVDLVLENRGFNQVGLQIQFWGRPQEQMSPGIKMSLLSGYIFGGQEQEQELVRDQSNQTVKFRGETTSKGKNFELITGNRWNEKSLSYLNVFYTDIDVKGSLSSVSENVMVYSNGEIENYGVLLGQKLDFRPDPDDEGNRTPFISLGVEGGFAQTRLRKYVKKNNFTLGLQGAVTF